MKTILIDSKTGKAINIKRPKNYKQIEKAAQDSARRLLAALADPTGRTPI